MAKKKVARRRTQEMELEQKRDNRQAQLVPAELEDEREGQVKTAEHNEAAKMSDSEERRTKSDRPRENSDFPRGALVAKKKAADVEEVAATNKSGNDGEVGQKTECSDLEVLVTPQHTPRVGYDKGTGTKVREMVSLVNDKAGKSPSARSNSSGRDSEPGKAGKSVNPLPFRPVPAGEVQQSESPKLSENDHGEVQQGREDGEQEYVWVADAARLDWWEASNLDDTKEHQVYRDMEDSDEKETIWYDICTDSEWLLLKIP